MAHYEDLTIDQGADVVIQLELFNPDGSRKLLINWDSDAGSFGSYYIMRGKIKKSYNSTDSAELFGHVLHLIQLIKKIFYKYH